MSSGSGGALLQHNQRMDYQTTLQGWHTFCAITGEAAASLTGALFVGLETTAAQADK
jgi:hypothetical protein